MNRSVVQLHDLPSHASKNLVLLNSFKKRHFTFPSLIRYLAIVLKYSPLFLTTLNFHPFNSSSGPISPDFPSRFPRITPVFRERIMMVTTSVNDCRYCSFFHSKMALEAGCSEDEVRLLLGSELSCAQSSELPALLFAQHYAESLENPSHLAVKELLRHYGRAGTLRILLSCIMITAGNLLGNTIDAYESRLLGRPAVGGSAWFEGLLYYLAIRPLRKMLQE